MATFFLLYIMVSKCFIAVDYVGTYKLRCLQKTKISVKNSHQHDMTNASRSTLETRIHSYVIWAVVNHQARGTTNHSNT